MVSRSRRTLPRGQVQGRNTLFVTGVRGGARQPRNAATFSVATSAGKFRRGVQRSPALAVPCVHVRAGLDKRIDDPGDGVAVRLSAGRQPVQWGLTVLISGMHIRPGAQTTDDTFPWGPPRKGMSPSSRRPWAAGVSPRSSTADWVGPQREELVDDRLVTVPHGHVQRGLAAVVAGVDVRAGGRPGRGP